MGMPRRVSSYDPDVRLLELCLPASGAFLLGVSVIPFLLNLVQLTGDAGKQRRPTPVERDRPWRDAASHLRRELRGRT